MSDRWLGSRNDRTFSAPFSGFWLSMVCAFFFLFKPTDRRASAGTWRWQCAISVSASCPADVGHFSVYVVDARLWPLRRLQGRRLGEGSLFALRPGASVVTDLVQGIRRILSQSRFTTRIENKMFSSVPHYIGQCWPTRLAVIILPAVDPGLAAAELRELSGDLRFSRYECGGQPLSSRRLAMVFRNTGDRQALGAGWLAVHHGRPVQPSRWWFVDDAAAGAAGSCRKMAKDQARAGGGGRASPASACMALEWQEDADGGKARHFRKCIEGLNTNSLPRTIFFFFSFLGMHFMTVQRSAEAIQHFEAAVASVQISGSRTPSRICSSQTPTGFPMQIGNTKSIASKARLREAH